MNFDYSYVRRQPVNFKQINKILQKASKTIEAAKGTLSVSHEDSFTLSYESMLKITLALMLSRGYRPKVQLGHHKTLVNFARLVLKNGFSKITATYEMMRKKRNKLIYDISSVSESEAQESLKVAEKYFQIVQTKISSDNPQQELWKP